MIERRTFTLGAGAFIAATSLRSAQAQSLIEIWQNSASRRYFVDISARCGAPGHTFVRAGVELDNGLIWHQAIFGLYPDGGGWGVVKSIVQSVPGIVTATMKDIGLPSVSVQKTVDEAVFNEVMNLYRQWLDDAPKYALLGNNCSIFAGQVATLVGLTLPSEDPGTTLPCNYVEALKKVNP